MEVFESRTVTALPAAEKKRVAGEESIGFRGESVGELKGRTSSPITEILQKRNYGENKV